MLAASKPCARKTSRAPLRIWRRLALSSPLSEPVVSVPGGSILMDVAPNSRSVNDRTVRLLLIWVLGSLNQGGQDRTVRSTYHARRITSMQRVLFRRLPQLLSRHPPRFASPAAEPAEDYQ